MGPPERGILDRAIRDALGESAAAYEARRIRVVTDLHATDPITNRDSLLYRAVYTIFRALPDRLAPGSALRVSTRMMAGGDVELTWDASGGEEGARPDGDVGALLAAGPHGDVLELAVLALEEFCRARLGWFERSEGSARVLALIPSIERSAESYPGGPRR